MFNQVSEEAMDRLNKFVYQSTKMFDESHNWQHANKVYENTMKIARAMINKDKEKGKEYDEGILTYASKLHDVCDHKYPNSISREALIDFIKSAFWDVRSHYVIDIIENISFSKEFSGKCHDFSEVMISHKNNNGWTSLQEYITIVADADRLEAIGNIGITRCEQFIRARGGKVPENVVQHCYDKLLRLYDDHYIKTDYARELALPLHQEIVAYVREHEKL